MRWASGQMAADLHCVWWKNRGQIMKHEDLFTMNRPSMRERHMKGLKRAVCAAVVCVVLLGIASLVMGQVPGGRAPGAQAGQAPAGRGAAAMPPKPIAEEYLLLGDETRGSGEAQIVVDPTDPNNIVAVGMGTWQMIPGCEAPNVNCKDFHNYPNSTHPVAAVTHDGGRTWQHFILPVIDDSTAYDKRTRCPDPFTGSTKEGILLAGCEPRETSATVIDPPGGTALVVSTNHGKTWSKRVEGISDYTGPNYPAFAPGLKPRHGANAPWDRPWLSVDDKTGTIYLMSSGGSTNIDTGSPDKYRTESYFTVSHNKGQSFGTIYAMDTLDWPQSAALPPPPDRAHMRWFTWPAKFRPVKPQPALVRSSASAPMKERPSLDT